MNFLSRKTPRIFILILVAIAIGLNFPQSPLSKSIHDWAQVRKYIKANEMLRAKPIDSERIVFMGDSITEYWGGAQNSIFQNPHFINRGIAGQNTVQMLARFSRDALELSPKTIVILGGTNDIAGTHGEVSNQIIEHNIDKMCQMAREKNIKIILSKVLPAAHYNWSPHVQPVPRIIALNQWIENYARENNYPLIDYYSPMVDAQNGLKPNLTSDGVHPNDAGYEVMRAQILPILAQ